MGVLRGLRRRRAGAGMSFDACVHGCDDGWITKPTGLMPCPRHKRTTHERWAAGKYKPTGGRTDVAAPAPATADTGRAGLTLARHALNPISPRQHAA